MLQQRVMNINLSHLTGPLEWLWHWSRCKIWGFSWW